MSRCLLDDVKLRWLEKMDFRVAVVAVGKVYDG